MGPGGCMGVRRAKWSAAGAALLAAAATLSLPGRSSAANTRPAGHRAIFIAGCWGRAAVAPTTFPFECTSGLAAPPLPYAYGLKYRHYGTKVATATGSVWICLEGEPALFRRCTRPWGVAEWPEESAHTFRASFRFFGVQHCSGGPNKITPGLYYTRIGYTFAGRAWETLSHLPFVEGADEQQPACHPWRGSL